MGWQTTENAPYGKYVLVYAEHAPWKDQTDDPLYVAAKRVEGRDGFVDRWQAFGPTSFSGNQVTRWHPIP